MGAEPVRTKKITGLRLSHCPCQSMPSGTESEIQKGPHRNALCRRYWMVWAGSLTVGICLEIFALNSTRQAAAPPPWTSYTPQFGMGKPI